MAEHQDKKRKVDEGAGEEPTQELIELEGIQSKLDEINEKALEKVFEVEREFNQKRRPVYQDRQKILAKVPHFWQQALLAHPLIRQMVTDDDIEVLQYCTEVDVEEFEDIKSGYKITLQFDQNPFFPESRLVKEFHNKDEQEIHVHGNVPSWKEGMAPVEEIQPTEGEAYLTKGRQYRLMMWFVENETLGLGAHDPLADIVKEEIWPNPLKFYNNEVEDDSQMGLEEDESEMISGEEEDEDGGDAGQEVYEEEGGEDEEGSDEGQD
mmetsp:Transcript_18896/g.49226  ORF Transcript_18896/g.49226 Transcript_18896/m.49226 type:complete len:266 (+) Transcript_18896:546-1343(+)|eukprot:CAMPEP_0202355112 /NCGR_PEP_ID=MMETSP1126-20121109/10141_1 /ASSEMBLY_ACC=CAM_ASM_000457 /TAXON_ID=3047 /ORGANISM="Dunaliella tertiolecta, Strain CCMP1320" /LENGTH=265 /DNA_ID=CAMNT_0048947671 /DNA_START=51 /DNA_END=848 /DNA_ORIENTATION=-